MASSAPNCNKKVPPVKKVGTLNVLVTGDQDVTKVCHKILAFIKTVDRQGVVEVFLEGEKVAKVKEKNLLD